MTRLKSFVAIAAALLAVLVPTSATQAADTSKHTARAYDRWAWFTDTYWIVPKKGIYSVMHLEDGNRFVVSRGQTVFHITDYFNGYWTGVVTVKITKSQIPTCQYVLGQVTPEGRVYMTMYDTDTGAVINNPIGSMVWKKGAWTMVNQMTGPMTAGTLSHWAYMVQSKKGDATYKRLPFAQQSIPKFMSACPKGPKLDNAFG